MTGIDRLRAIAGAWDEWGLGGTLAEMADQIERERAEDCYRMGLDYGTVWRVVADMERHCLGHEGMEDSPVARWARELRGALKSDASDGRDTQNPSCADPDSAADVTSDAPKVTRDPAEDVSMSAYDLLPADERDAIAWVRKHGGIDHVRAEWISRVPYDLYQRRRWRLLGHIAECETALGRRREIISELTHRVSDLTRENAELRRRAMPEGMEWMLWDDGKPVTYDDAPDDVIGVYLTLDGSGYVLMTDLPDQLMSESSERVKRPAPAVPAGDGEPLEVGQTVWDTDDETDTPLTVVEVSSDLVRCEYTWKDGKTYRPCYPPSTLTHTKPEPPDSWQRIEEDALNFVEDNAGIPHDQDQMERDMLTILRRCRALAERERGE